MLEIFPGCLFFEAALGNLVEKLAAADVFHDKVDLGFCGHDLKELHDVGVADAAEDRDFALYVRDEAALEDFLLVDHFYGDALVGFHVAGVVDFRKSAVTQQLTDLVPP